MKILHIVSVSRRWLFLLPSILLIAFAIFALWFISDATIVGSAGRVEERTQLTDHARSAGVEGGTA
jgi:hypothetical protein